MAQASPPLASRRVVPLVDARVHAALPQDYSHAAPVPATGLLQDTHGRPLHDLRISVTDRCNFRCSYCMPKDVFDKDHVYLPMRRCCALKRSPGWPGCLRPMACARSA